MQIDLRRTFAELVRAQVEARPASETIIVLRGTLEQLQQARPHWAKVWPQTNVITAAFLPNLSIHGLNVEDVQAEPGVTALLKLLLASDTSPDATTASGRHAPSDQSIKKQDDPPKRLNVVLDVSTLGLLCWESNQALYMQYFETIIPSFGTRDAFTRAIDESCQHGALSSYSPSSPAKEVPGFEHRPGIEGRHISNATQLNLQTDWMLARSADVLTPARSQFYFWVKTINEGGGSGFMRDPAARGVLDDEHAIRNIQYAAIHSGWGALADPASSQPWHVSDKINLFRCEHAHYTDCARHSVLVRLLPDNTLDNRVTIANSAVFNVSATITPSTTKPPIDQSSYTFGATMTFGYASTRTSSREAQLMQAQTYGNAPHFRSTDWKPQWAVLKAWTQSTGGCPQPLDTATPLASTLNPNYDVLWQIPADGNTDGSPKRYSIVYESRWQHCDRLQLQRGSSFCPRRISTPSGTPSLGKHAPIGRIPFSVTLIDLAKQNA